jgi:hypothetical protein
MYYTELGLRDVILRSDEQGNFHIQGEFVGGDSSTAIELCEIFLEYAMYCCAWCDLEEALYHMQDFAEHIGHSIGKFLRENTYLVRLENPIDRALEHLFQTMNARITIKYSGAIENFIVIDFPLEEAAQRSGLRNIELAHHGINIMCQSMIEVMQPEVTLKTSPAIHPEFAFTILKPEFS